jgi:hypothetical protein
MMVRRLGTLLLLLVLGLSSSSGARPGHVQAQSTSAPTTKTFSDNFDDPARGGLAVSATTATYRFGYVDGEYQIALSGSDVPLPGTASAPGAFSDVTVAVDVRFLGDPGTQQAGVTCRLQPLGANATNGYWFGILPATASYALLRADASKFTALADVQPASAIHPGNETNHLELSCLGNTIAASVNGTQVVTVQDSTYGLGQASITAGPMVPGMSVTTSDVRFDNLLVTGTPPPSGTELASDKLTASTGILPTTFTLPASRGGYSQGEYQIVKTDPAANTLAIDSIPGNYPDVSIAIDVRLASLDRDSNAGQGELIGCRYRRGLAGNDAVSGYELLFFPAQGIFNLARVDAGKVVSLTNGPASGTPTLGVPHHLELTCFGDTLTASVDGKQVASVHDTTYSVGMTFIGAGVQTAFLPGTVDARFSNVVLTQP